jgi:hypothetical protein
VIPAGGDVQLSIGNSQVTQILQTGVFVSQNNSFLVLRHLPFHRTPYIHHTNVLNSDNTENKVFALL